MKRKPLLFATFLTSCVAWAADPALTIYNQNFAVVRDTVPLELKPGVNHLQFTGATAHVEPDSVILRDPTGKVPFKVLEQNYRNDPVSEGLLLSLNEGKTIEFLVKEPNKPDHVVEGKIIRSGYPGQSAQAISAFGQRYYQMQQAHGYQNGTLSQPIIEVNGKLQFSLPGQPIFPALGDDTVLKPTLEWQIAGETEAKLNAEIGYVTEGMTWKADYNVIAPEKGDAVEVVGWITMENASGRTFPNAAIKLMAGDVHKLQQEDGDSFAMAKAAFAVSDAAAPVKQKAFDDYHLYTLPRPTTLHDGETKQVEFLRASGVPSKRLYVYDGLSLDSRWRNYTMEGIRGNQEYGTQSQSKVWSMLEFVNSEANHLGLPLPRGKVRCYRQEEGGQLQFVGEDLIDHTAKNETFRIYTGNAFDLVGERRRTRFREDSSNRTVDESFEIRLRNHKTEAAEIRVVEHLYRWSNWKITQSSSPFSQMDSKTIEFRIPVKPDQEQVLTYDVHYSW